DPRAALHVGDVDEFETVEDERPVVAPDDVHEGGRLTRGVRRPTARATGTWRRARAERHREALERPRRHPTPVRERDRNGGRQQQHQCPQDPSHGSPPLWPFPAPRRQASERVPARAPPPGSGAAARYAWARSQQILAFTAATFLGLFDPTMPGLRTCTLPVLLLAGVLSSALAD